MFRELMSTSEMAHYQNSHNKEAETGLISDQMWYESDYSSSKGGLKAVKGPRDMMQHGKALDIIGILKRGTTKPNHRLPVAYQR